MIHREMNTKAAPRGGLRFRVYGALGETRTRGLSLRRAALYPLSYQRMESMVPKVGFEPTRANAHYALNVARLPFRHFGAE
jgi:hypothetical protein